METNCADSHTAKMESGDWLVRHSPLHRSLLQSKNELMIISENVSFSVRFSGKLSGSAQFFLFFLWESSMHSSCSLCRFHCIDDLVLFFLSAQPSLPCQGLSGSAHEGVNKVRHTFLFWCFSVCLNTHRVEIV